MGYSQAYTYRNQPVEDSCGIDNPELSNNFKSKLQRKSKVQIGYHANYVITMPLIGNCLFLEREAITGEVACLGSA
jgi:hypothetical protein